MSFSHPSEPHKGGAGPNDPLFSWCDSHRSIQPMVKSKAIGHVNTIIKAWGWDTAFGHSFWISGASLKKLVQKSFTLLGAGVLWPMKSTLGPSSKLPPAILEACSLVLKSSEPPLSLVGYASQDPLQYCSLSLGEWLDLTPRSKSS